MTEAEKIATRAKIFANLGLGPDGMCKTTTPVLSRALNQSMDKASLSALSAPEIETCQTQDVRPSDYIAARGVVNPAANAFAAAAETDKEILESVRESLAKFAAGVNGTAGRRQHLENARKALMRALKWTL